ncbi:hypothetical protein evm_001049 [Chilo suppressalis]|nr:hypothetical protein evm_001049 [Chilo suppressalis]
MLGCAPRRVTSVISVTAKNISFSSADDSRAVARAVSPLRWYALYCLLDRLCADWSLRHVASRRATSVLDATNCIHVTTACRLCEDIVPPDGGDLRRGAIDGPFSSPLQPLLPSLRQHVPKRHRHGCLRWQRPAESHHQHTRVQPRTTHPLSDAGHVPMLQPVAAGRQAIDAIPSGETAQLLVQRRVCGRIQQIPPDEERRPLHRFQQTRHAAATRQESSAQACSQVLLVYKGGPRFRHQQAQHCPRRRLEASAA